MTFLEARLGTILLAATAFISTFAPLRTMASTTLPKMPARDVAAAFQDLEYALNMQPVPMTDIVVAMHENVAYAYAAVGVDGRGALLRKDGAEWHVVGEAKGRFSPDIFSSLGVPPRIALMAVQDQCPPLRVAWTSMTVDQRKLVARQDVRHLAARSVRDIYGKMYALPSIAYRVCRI